MNRCTETRKENGLVPLGGKTSATPLRIAVAGIGGYAASHHAVLSQIEAAGRVKVVATSDPRFPEMSSLCEQFAFPARGVQVWGQFGEMLTAGKAAPDVAIIATPIHLHAGMHEACVNRDVACYLEKPPTLDPQELERMINVDLRAKYASHVGFHFIHQKERLALKQRMMTAEFGPLKRVAFLGLGKRTSAYYQRNGWAGRLRLGDQLVLDSCFGNAFSHYLNNLLFLAGLDDLHSWARPREAETELYRANAIETADTVFASGRLHNDVEFRIAASHACPDENISLELLEFERATVRIEATRSLEITHLGRRREQAILPPASLSENLMGYFDYLAGSRPRPWVRLEDCRSFVHLNALLYMSAPRIVSVSPKYIESIAEGDSALSFTIQGVQTAAAQFVSDGTFPSRAGFPWAETGGRSEIEHLTRFREAIARLGVPAGATSK